MRQNSSISPKIDRGKSILGEGRTVPKESLALGHPLGCTGASLVALEQETLLGLSGPRSKNPKCSFPYRLSGNPGICALYQAIRTPILVTLSHSEFVVVWAIPGPGGRPETHLLPGQQVLTLAQKAL